MSDVTQLKKLLFNMKGVIMKIENVTRESEHHVKYRY